MIQLYESGENYLATIFALEKKGCDVRSVDIAREMSVSKPSVSRAIGLLKDGGFIDTTDGGYITLTQKGSEIAERIYECRCLFTQLFIHIGVDEKTASEDAGKLEHGISAAALEKIKEHIREGHEKRAANCPHCGSAQMI